MLQNAYLVAKIGADTAENELNFAEILPKFGNYPAGPVLCTRFRASSRSVSVIACCTSRRATGPAEIRSHLSQARVNKICNVCSFFLNFAKKWRARSRLYRKRDFARKYAFDSIFSSSTRFASFCTAAISIFSQKIGLKNQQFS